MSKPKVPEPRPPAEMPDPYDAALGDERRKKMRRTSSNSSANSNQLAEVPGTISAAFVRKTLG